MRLGQKILGMLFEPVDIASLATFRVMLGGLLAWDAARYVLAGWIADHYVTPAFQFKFMGFLWVDTMNAFGMYAVFGAMVATGVTIGLGYFYRLSCVLYTLLHTYVFLAASEYYLNHAYLISVFMLMMAFVPAHRALSLDAVRQQGLYSRRIPAWPLFFLCGLVVVVFVFGAIAKMNADWFAGVPVRQWLADRANTSVVGPLLRSEAVISVVAQYGCVFDLVVGPLLIWRRTRLFGIAGSIGFHLSNAYLFSIGVFPWFMLAATTLFFHPSWPRSMPIYGRDIDRALDMLGVDGNPTREPAARVNQTRQRRIVYAMSTFFAVQIALPLRHHLYPGNVAWTEEGHYFSWRMKLRHKDGRIGFRVTDSATGQSWKVDPHENLDDHQVVKMLGRPDNILQYAHYLRDAYAREGRHVEVRTDAFVALNYRAEQRFIDPEVDLARQRFSLMPYSWILPFDDTPLPPVVAPAERSLSVLADRIGNAAAMGGALGGGRRVKTAPAYERHRIAPPTPRGETESE